MPERSEVKRMQELLLRDMKVSKCSRVVYIEQMERHKKDGEPFLKRVDLNESMDINEMMSCSTLKPRTVPLARCFYADPKEHVRSAWSNAAYELHINHFDYNGGQLAMRMLCNNQYYGSLVFGFSQGSKLEFIPLSWLKEEPYNSRRLNLIIWFAEPFERAQAGLPPSDVYDRCLVLVDCGAFKNFALYNWIPSIKEDEYVLPQVWGKNLQDPLKDNGALLMWIDTLLFEKQHLWKQTPVVEFVIRHPELFPGVGAYTSSEVFELLWLRFQIPLDQKYNTVLEFAKFLSCFLTVLELFDKKMDSINNSPTIEYLRYHNEQQVKRVMWSFYAYRRVNAHTVKIGPSLQIWTTQLGGYDKISAKPNAPPQYWKQGKEDKTSTWQLLKTRPWAPGLLGVGSASWHSKAEVNDLDEDNVILSAWTATVARRKQTNIGKLLTPICKKKRDDTRNRGNKGHREALQIAKKTWGVQQYSHYVKFMINAIGATASALASR